MFCSIPEKCKPIQAINPKTTNGALTGAYISLKNAVKVWIILNFTQAVGHATAITVEQASAIAGTGSKVISVVQPIWANEDTAASDELVRQTNAVGYTVAADVKNKTVVIQIDPATLDINNGFDCIVVKTAASAQVTNFVSASYFIENKYSQATPPSNVID